MADFEVTVSGNPPKGTYKVNGVATNGDISIDYDTTKTIEFTRENGESWSFVSPGISFTLNDKSVSGPFTVTGQNAGTVSVTDVDANQGKNKSYKYTLVTDQGDFDPQIINKGKLG